MLNVLDALAIDEEEDVLAQATTTQITGTLLGKDPDTQIGEITSGTFGPSVNGPIAMGYVEREFSKVDTKILLEVRGKKYPANICALPFYKKNYVKGVN